MYRYRYISLLLVALAGSAPAQERSVGRIPTPFAEQGKPVTLEVVLYAPPGSGPFPTLMFNHGSTGRGDTPSLFTRTWASETVARFFNERGWLVAFPQRRGRGQSDGRYDEGFEWDRSRYTCSPVESLAGMERALQDLDAAVAYLRARPDVDPARMLVGGQSRGGILSVVYAGTRPGVFRGAVNFVGGWMSDSCVTVEAINTVSFRRGAGSPAPTVWLYGDNDSFYSLVHSRKNFDAFVEAGGKGTFSSFSLGFGRNGHGLIGRPELWKDALAAFLEQVR